MKTNNEAKPKPLTQKSENSNRTLAAEALYYDAYFKNKEGNLKVKCFRAEIGEGLFRLQTLRRQRFGADGEEFLRFEGCVPSNLYFGKCKPKISQISQR